MATIILGSQWGKLTDILAPKAQLCARAAGGHNAGHSIVANGISYSFHLLPSGLMTENLNLIGSGVVFHVPSFFKELDELEKKGLKGVHDRIFVSDRVHVDLDLHVAVDGLEEVELGASKIGTTCRGIGPSYSTKAARSGIRLSEVFNAELFEAKIRRLASSFQKRYGDLLKYDVEEEIARFNEYRPKLAKYTVDAVAFIKQAQDKNMKILVEGANALMLDIDYGTYPYVTSSNTGLGGIFTGLAINPTKIDEIIGVVKAYTTRVGGGPFVTEDTEEAGTKLQEIGREWGVSTGRKRRCGCTSILYFVSAQMIVMLIIHLQAINHYTALNLTKLDVLDTFPTIKVAVAYKDPDTGEEIPSFPADLSQLERVEVVYQELPGWNQPTAKIQTFMDLPVQARDYVHFIENFVGVKIKWIGTGPDREDMIYRTS
ncbi:adenylosuccinate synthetase [Sodiomyces alkalinus F11]|uniref:Adenylosuccinate synthetase n=1 Tax=Sodiomyces alkalinus (strain CBS 110278 / VKM F-3762 / F11) TaxID=1314773 RepID=A0A3N2PTD5_SODAK|nr:adenylosuccinate synthetase [Sodiomyces alkalinus F11]ROT37684.1 adenylosuccinate synthetase [Sodiomyces alkalinus F11]